MTINFCKQDKLAKTKKSVDGAVASTSADSSAGADTPVGDLRALLNGMEENRSENC